MLSSKAKRSSRPIHIRLTSEFLVVCVSLERLQNVSSSLYYSVPGYRSFLKSCNAQYPKLRKHLIISSHDIPDLRSLKRELYLKMRNVATSWGWTVDLLKSRGTPKEVVNTWLCRATSKQEKQYKEFAARAGGQWMQVGDKLMCVRPLQEAA